jgi:hypothetical protein
MAFENPRNIYLSLSDNDYRGSIISVLKNEGAAAIKLEKGHTYVQLVPTVYFDGHVVEFDLETEEDSETASTPDGMDPDILGDNEVIIRSGVGFGSTNL